VLAAALALACAAPRAEPEAEPDDALARGAALIAPFKQRLLAELTAALAQGPAHAIEVCSARAPQLAAEASVQGARVGRTSHRLRNPGNAPPAWADALLASYVAGESKAARAVSIAGGRIGYVEPIFMQPLCTTCHGEAIAPDLVSVLRARYPRDRAVGFRVGELRGLAWAELPSEGP
jgi:hypothetical protein